MAISQRLKSRMSMWYVEDLLANLQALQGPGEASQTSAGSGLNSSSASSDPALPGSWRKILLDSLASSLADSASSSGKWKPWVTRSKCSGSTVRMWAPLTAVTASSLWPTPTVSDAKRHAPETPDDKRRRGSHTGVCLTDAVGGSPHPDFLDWLMGFPIGWTEHPLSVTQLSLDLPK
jgi:hypothetical protein